jgi:acetyltransferase-like isoleucine patch superfamily enzyme
MIKYGKLLILFRVSKENGLNKALLILNNLPFLLGRSNLIKGNNVNIVGNKIETYGLVTMGLGGLENLFYEKTLITNHGRLVFLDHCDIGKGVRIFIGNNAKLRVGGNTFFTGNCLIYCSQEVNIGKNCAISWGVQILDTNFHQIKNNDSIKNKVVIGDNCWIGSNVSILPGVTIAENCVVAANSVLTMSFLSPGTLIAGVPAIEKRKDVHWKR